MSKIIYTDIVTNERIGDYEQTLKHLNEQPIRHQAFKRFTDYYITHGWYGGYCADLYVINLQPTKDVN